MELPSSNKRPPRSLSKQKSCGMILHSSQKGELSNNKRGCLTPNSKTATSSTSQQRRLGLQHSSSVKSKSELSKVSRNNLDGPKKHTTMSGSRRTPVSSKSRTESGTGQKTPRITPTGTRSPFSTTGSSKGKTKRDFERGRDDIRPNKRLAVSQEENDSDLLQNDEKKSCGSSVKQKNHKNTIPVAEVKPLSVVRNLYGNDEDMEDGSSNEKSETKLITGKAESFDLNNCYGSSMDKEFCSGDFSIHVAVRVRPFTKREKENDEIRCVVEMYDSTTTCITESNGHTHNFTYDMSFWSFDENDPTFACQEAVYKSSAQPLLDGVFKGYNTCLFAYGQTGSGKSHTMTGYDNEEEGIIPRFCEDMFIRIHNDSKLQFTVEISFFEIYNEKIRDLLLYSQDNPKQLRIREHPEQGPYVQDLSVFTVTCWEDIERWLAVGNKHRATAATGMNDRSSRSHSVFTILLTQRQVEYFENAETQLTRSCKVNLIDLAGSERANQVINEELAADNEAANCRLKEGSCINRSLHTLGKVISLLSETQTGAKKKLFVPYRESTLTWLLKESLGGNSRTAMIATISPANIHVAETLSTLRYARQARNIVNQVRVNEDSNTNMIRELLREIDRLKSTKVCPSDGHIGSKVAELDILKEKLKETKTLLSQATIEWENKLKMSELRWKEENERIKQSGIASKIDNTLPSLVNLNEDPMLSEILVYVLKEGKTTFGNSQSQDDHDIKLHGPLVADNHCHISYECKQVKIAPSGDSPVYVNGEQVTSSAVLRHGDRIVVGGTHFFRFNHPNSNTNRKPSKRELRKKWEGLTLKDFEFAKRELMEQQNAKLEAELEDSQVKAQEGLIDLITSAKETAEKQLTLQKEAYKEEVSELQKLLEETECKRRIAEKNRNMAEDKIIQLKSHKQALEEEIHMSRKRLQDEAFAAKQAFEETKANQLQIITELEREKSKIEDDVRKFKSKKTQRHVIRNEIRTAMTSAVGAKESDGKKDLLKIALLLREANKISQKLEKNITFSRDDILENDKVEIRIRLNETKHGKTTLWSLEKFEIMVAKMRDLYQANGILEEGEEDPFYESEEEWMDDFILDSPTLIEPGLNSSRMSVGRRFSLNHSLNLLTNLNASLSELSMRRRSSIAVNAAPVKTQVDKNEPLYSAAVLQEFMDASPALDRDRSICRHILDLLSNISSELQNYETKSMGRQKMAIRIVLLLQRLKECCMTWATTQNFFSYHVVAGKMETLIDSIEALFIECKIVLQAVGNNGVFTKSIHCIVDALKTVAFNIGELSLISADNLGESRDVFICPEKQQILCNSFIDGQCSTWKTLTSDLSDITDTALRRLRNMQLDSVDNIDTDLDDVANLLNSSLTMIQHVKEFQESWFERQKETDAGHLLSESTIFIQRQIIGNLTTLSNKLGNLVTKDRIKEMGEQDVKSFFDCLQSISKCCKCMLSRFVQLVNREKNSTQNENEACDRPEVITRIENEACSQNSVGSSLRELLGKLEFAIKAVQVGVAIVSQNLDELCFPDGRYSICLDGEDDELRSAEPIICPLSVVIVTS